MIESNNPEINVDELMARIREEVARRRANEATAPPSVLRSESLTKTAIAWSQVNVSMQAVEYHASRVGEVLPELARFGRVKRKIGQQVARIVLYLSRFITDQQKQFNWATLKALQAMSNSLRSLEGGFGEQERQKDERAEILNALQETVERVEQEHRAGLERLEVVEQAHRAGLERIEAIEQAHRAGLERLLPNLVRQEERAKELERTLYQLKVNLLQQERRLSVLLEEARKRLPEPFNQVQLQTLANEDQHRLDALYVSFEDQFRGTREDIKERLRVYLPLLKEKSIGTEQMPILDIGCGRGEWLELMRDEGLLAQGVDINRILVEQCRARGFKVTENDVHTYLRGLPDRSTGAVTGFHIVERLSLDSLIKLFDETVRVLAPGGVAIFETPNPQNIMVGSCNFHLDPTHKNVLPSSTLKFIAEARGLCRVEVWNLHPYPAAFRIDGSELAERFSEFFYGPQEYAVVGWKV